MQILWSITAIASLFVIVFILTREWSQLRVLPLCTRPLEAGRSFVFGAGAVRCLGGVVRARRSARWKRSALPNSSRTSISSTAGVLDRLMTRYPMAIFDVGRLKPQEPLSEAPRIAIARAAAGETHLARCMGWCWEGSRRGRGRRASPVARAEGPPSRKGGGL